jgi:hypothetical protein
MNAIADRDRAMSVLLAVVGISLALLFLAFLLVVFLSLPRRHSLNLKGKHVLVTGDSLLSHLPQFSYFQVVPKALARRSHSN